MNTAEFAARRAIPASVRRAVIARDGMACFHCSVPVVRTRRGEPWRPDALHLDHILPWAAGGPDTVDNLVVSCARCNTCRGRKGATVVRQSIVRLEFRYGAYYWPEEYVPPRILGDDEVGFLLRELIDRRNTLVRLLSGIHRGELSATASGKIYVGLRGGPIPVSRHERRGRRRML